MTAIRTGDTAEFDRAVDLLQLERRTGSADDAERGVNLAFLGQVLTFRGNEGDLDEAITVYDEAMEAISIDDPDRTQIMASLGAAIATRFVDGGTLADGNRAIATLREATNAIPEGGSIRASHLVVLATALLERYEREEALADEKEAIDILREAAFTVATDDPDLPEPFSGIVLPPQHTGLNILAMALMNRYLRDQRPADLDEAIEALRRARRLPGNHGNPAVPPGRHLGALAKGIPSETTLVNLGSALISRFVNPRETADLDEAIDTLRSAAKAIETHDSQRIAALAILGGALLTRFDRRSAVSDIDEAVDVLRDAARPTMPRQSDQRDPISGDLVDRGQILTQLGTALERRYDHQHGQSADTRSHPASDLDAAIDAFRDAVRETRGDHQDRPHRLGELGAALINRYVSSGRPADLDEAINVGRETVRTISDDDTDRPLRIVQLASGLGLRFHRDGSFADLDEAVDVARLALAATPDGHPDRSLSLTTLAIRLRARFRNLRSDEDLDEAIELARLAVAASTDDLSRAGALSVLGGALDTRYQHDASSADLNEAIDALRGAVAAIPADRPWSRVTVRGTLAIALRHRFDNGGPLTDVDEAIEAQREKLRFEPPDDPARPYTLSGLGDALGSRFRRTGGPEEFQEAVSIYRTVAMMPTASAGIRLQAAKSWADLADQIGDWELAAQGYSHAVELLPLLAWRGALRQDQERWLAEHAGLAGDAATAMILAGNPDHAVEVLEHGRGVLLAQVLHTRTDITDLHDQHPELARQLDDIRTALDPPTTDEPSIGQFDGPHVAAKTLERDTRRQVAQDWDRLLERVRRLDGFTQFLHPPSLAQLQASSVDGPIVLINPNERRSDALIVTADQIRTQPLPDLTPDRVIENIGDLYNALYDPTKLSARSIMHDVLAWLWDAAAGPVLEALGYAPTAPDAAPPRLWWIPVGPLTFLPVHAAGRPGDGVIDRVISSYTPTIGALAHARAQRHTDVDRTSVTIVALPEHGLPNARREAEHIARLFPAARQLVDTQATRDNVRSALDASTIMHFACHGSQDPDQPSSGYLQLHDGELRVLELTRLRLRNADLAYLSACMTATGGADLADEAIHLAATMQLAGYRHVIGTLWPIDDAIGADVANTVYTQLATSDGGINTATSAHALHDAIRRIRADYPDRPDLWASYIHLGP